MKEVIVVYTADQWLSTDSLRVMAVCSQWSSVMDVVKDILINNGLKEREELTEDETESVEDYLAEFEKNRQCLCRTFGICMEVFGLNERPYSL